MKKRDKAKAKPEPAAAITMSIDAILAQLASLKDNAHDSMTNDPDFDEVWKKDIEACEAATAILSALQDEGVRDPEQVRDMIADYRSLGEQYSKMHQKYENPAPPIRIGNRVTVCPDCKTPLYRYPKHCPGCGKRLTHDGR